MLKRSFSKHLFLVAVVAAVIAGSGFASALDVADVQNLMRNHVAEDVIINMVRSDGTIFITTEEANVLRSMGASENLIQALRPRSITTGSNPSPIVRGEAVVESEEPFDDDDAESLVAGDRVVVQPVPSAAVVAAPLATPVDGSPITPVSVTRSSPFPARFEKEGWLSIFNRDWTPYYVSVNPGNKRLFISRAPNGGIMVQSGENVVVNLRKETYKLYGDTGEDLKIRVRENETTTLSLNPFGVFGNSGLTGVATDRDRVRTEVLFAPVAPAAIVVEQAPVIVVPGPRPPVYYHRGPYHRPYRGGFYFGHGRW